METHIIERNQIIKKKIFNYWFYAFVIYLIIVIPKIAFSMGEPIVFEKEFSILSIFFGLTGIIFFVINIFSFKKTGLLKIENKKIKIENKGLKNEIDLAIINNLKFKRIQGNIYKLFLNDISLEIALDRHSLTELKEISARYL